MAINRPGIVDRIMEKEAIPASQLLPDSFFGTSKALKPVAYDMNGAKKLLAEAGYPNGFKMKLHGPTNRYLNDTKIIEAVAQMFSRLGIETEVETLPAANFFTRADLAFVWASLPCSTSAEFARSVIMAICASLSEGLGEGVPAPGAASEFD